MKQILIISIIISIIIMLLSISLAVGEPNFFAIETEKENQITTEKTINDIFYGGLLIPEHLQNSHYSVTKYPNKRTTLPIKWDWRKHGGVTSVKDQGACGSCYAFGSIGIIESYILIDSGNAYDLSEEQGKNCMWEATGCLGGSVIWDMNIFTQNGVILEKDFPYNPSTGLCKNIEPKFRVTEWNMLSAEKTLSQDIMKNYILDNGPIVTSLIVDSWESNYNGSYVLSNLDNNLDRGDKSHCVLVVGWNDSLSDKNVSGHWIFKNSWGDNWGDNGYGYIEYDTANIGAHASVIGEYENYDPNVYTLNYDEAGWNYGIGAAGFERLRGMCIYETNTSEIKGIEFWTTGATKADLYLYDNITLGKPVLYGNELYNITNLQYNEPGYHSHVINENIISTTGTTVVIIEIENEDSVYSSTSSTIIAIDNKGPYKPGETYISVGDKTSVHYDVWEDLSNLPIVNGAPIQGSIALRLRITGEPPSTCQYIFLETEGYVRNVTVGDNIQFNVKCADEYGAYVECSNMTWHNSNETIGIINDVIFEARASGNTTIYVEGICGFKESNKIDIVVSEKENELNNKQYLTDEEFKERMAELQVQLNEAELKQKDELNEIMELLNNTDIPDDTTIIIPPDAVSMDTFNEIMNDMEQQIEDMKNKSTSLFQRIIERIIELFD